MTPPNPQPVLPVEGAFSDAEKVFITEQPPGLFPDNQNSNWGALRAVLTDEMQDAVTQLDDLFNELFIDTASPYLSKWETQMGLPISSGLSDARRRTNLSSRRARANFTHARIAALVERYISDTFGAAAEFSGAGISLAGGIPLYSGASNPSTLYRIYEDIRNFAYTIWIRSDVTPDMVALLRELNWITPAHIAVTVDNTHANVLSYWREIRNKQPQQWYQLDNDATDFSGNTGFNGTFFNAPANVASLVSVAAGGGSAMSFNGTTQYMTAPSSPLGDLFSIEMWIKPTNFTGNPRLVTKGGTSYEIYIDSTGVVRLQVPATATIVAHSSISLTAGQVYHIVVEKNGATAKIFINGVDRTIVDSTVVVFADNANPITVARYDSGASNFYNGVIDDLAFYTRQLTASEVLRDYNTGINVA
jgi:hypothetical protein